MRKREDERPATSRRPAVYDRLIEEIHAGSLLPGARLTETDIAERLGVSRTPIREALRRLEAEGLVVHRPRVGATLRELSYSEVMELYEMRSVLECAAARMAARAASDIEISELAAINADMDNARTDPIRLYELNRQFHLALLDAAKNRFLTQAINGLQKTLLILGPTTLADSQRAEEAVAEHDAVLAALRSRDGDAAASAMQNHIQAAHRVRLRQLRDGGGR